MDGLNMHLPSSKHHPLVCGVGPTDGGSLLQGGGHTRQRFVRGRRSPAVPSLPFLRDTGVMQEQVPGGPPLMNGAG